MKLSDTGHEQFIRIVRNGIARYEQSGKPFVTGFLSPARQTLAKNLCKGLPFYFAGGRSDAIRARLIVGESRQKEPMDPFDWQAYDWDSCNWDAYGEDQSYGQDFAAEADAGTEQANREGTDEKQESFDSKYLSLLEADYDSSQKTLSHSDVLGALMHAGLERDAIGDIALDEGRIWVVCLPSVADFIKSSLSQIGRVSVRFQDGSLAGMPKTKYKALKVNTASMRADCLVAAIAHCSRSIAKDMICQGFVKVNDEVLESVRTLCNNDTISVRRAGKFRIGELDGVSRKGRLIVNIYQYQ